MYYCFHLKSAKFSDMKKAVIIMAILIISRIATGQTLYTIGAGGSYATISAGYAACSGAQNYILEIRSDYVLEALPISLAANPATSVTIRPANGVTVNVVNSIAVNTIFSFTGGDNITIDGRQGGTGSPAFTIENTGNATTKYALLFSGGSTNNTIKYCTIKGSNTVAAASAVTGGVICFTSGTNNNNTIDNCIVTRSGANKPAVGILSYDGTNNNMLIITNCSFIDFTRYGIWASGNKNTGWTISNNKFYQTAAIIPAPAGVMAAVKIDNGGGYTLSGNNIGGRAGGNSPYTITGNGTSGFIGIYFSNSTTATTNTITQNTINDILITISASNGASPFCFTGINAAGAANYMIGGLTNSNTIGDMTGTTYKIAITAGAGISIGNGFSAINNEGTGTTTISYNNIGSIDLSGISKEYPYVNIIRNYNASGTITIDNNTIGNTVADNINMGGQFADVILNDWSSNTSTFTVTNNIVRNIYGSGSTSWLNLINNSSSQSPMTCTGNTITSISSSGSQNLVCINHAAPKTATISNNTINTITTTNAGSAFKVICLNESAGALNATINDNTIGTSSVNNISLAGNSEQYAIEILNGGTITCNNNVIQNVTFTSTGSSSVFWGIDIGSSSTKGTAILNATNNTIQDITTSSSHEYNESFSGIRIYSSSSGHVITNNSVRRISNINTTTCAHEINGIAIRSSGAGGGTVTKNLIVELYTSIVNGTVHGICDDISSGTWKFYNNAILISNTGQHWIEGMHIAGTDILYHNTVKLSGTTSGAVQTTALDFLYSTTITSKNNVFQNLITGGTLGNYAVMNSYGAGSTFTETNDYLEAADPNKIGYYFFGADKTFAGWNAMVVGATGNINGNSSPVTLDAIGQPPTGAPLAAAGANLSATVSDDRLSAIRPAAPYPGAYEPAISMPITLLLFDGYKNENSIKLNWVTATETNNDYFTVEKSTDGYLFETVGNVDGAGNSKETLNYTSVDYNPIDGFNYYRLKQTDFDGNFSYSNIIAVDYSKKKILADADVFPNPFTTGFFIDISGLNSTNIRIQIENLYGQLVFNCDNCSSDNGIVNVSLNTTIDSGYYVVKIKYNESIIVKKILKYKN